MPHKRNPVSSTVILAAHGGRAGPRRHAARPPWRPRTSVRPACGTPSGTPCRSSSASPPARLHEARALAEGLEVHADRMRANIDATRGLLFADAVAARWRRAGREAAHALVEHAAEQVRPSGAPLARGAGELIRPSRSRGADMILDAAFDLTPYVDAAAGWTAAPCGGGTRSRERLSSP